IDDYQESSSLDTSTGSTRPIELPKSNVLIYTTEDGTRLAARPSGTEPKIKFYVSVSGKISDTGDYPAASRDLESKMDRILEELKLNG
ncbi:MAG: phospho-sugar mutase, partial [Robiginitalea sp.]